MILNFNPGILISFFLLTICFLVQFCVSNHGVMNGLNNGAAIGIKHRNNHHPTKSNQFNLMMSQSHHNQHLSLSTTNKHITPIHAIKNGYNGNDESFEDIDNDWQNYIQKQKDLYDETGGNEGFDIRNIYEQLLYNHELYNTDNTPNYTIDEMNNDADETNALIEQQINKGGIDIGKFGSNQIPKREGHSKTNIYQLIKKLNGLKTDKNKVLMEKIVSWKNKFFHGKNKKEEFEEFFQYLKLFAPDSFLSAFIDIPDEGRQLLIETFADILKDLKNNNKNGNKSIVDLKEYKDKLINSDLNDETKEKIKKFFNIVQKDFNQLPQYLTNNFATLFEKIAENGMPGLNHALIEYLQVWEKATPKDQEKMAETFPKLAFFYNDKKSMTMNNWALNSAQGIIFYKLPLLILVKMIFMNKPKLEKEDNELYKEMHVKLLADFKANKPFIDEIGKFFIPFKPIVGSPDYKNE